MDRDCADVLSKGMSMDTASFSGVGVISPVTLQMQKHLLSSTLQTSSETGKLRTSRNGSCSPTPALPYTPTPSPSPFNPLSPSINTSLPDLGLSLSGESKNIGFLTEKRPGFTSPGGFEEIDLSKGAKYADIASIGQLQMSAGGSADMPSPRFSPQIEINSMLSFSEPNSSVLNLPVSSGQDKLKGYLMMDASGRTNVTNSIPILSTQQVNFPNNIRLLGVEEANKTMKILPASLPSQIASPIEILPKSNGNIRLVSELQSCMNTLNSVSSHEALCLSGIPAVTTDQVGGLQNVHSVASAQISCLPSISTIGRLDCLPSSSTNQNTGILAEGYETFPPNMMHPKKKARLLTFLADGNNVDTICSVKSDDLIATHSEPTKSDNYILSPNCPPIVAVSSNSRNIIINPTETIISVTKSEPTLYLTPSATICSVSNSEPTIFLNPSVPTKPKPTIYINPSISSGSKSDPTIFLNPDGSSLLSGKKTSIYLSEGSESIQSKEPNTEMYINQQEPMSKNEQTLIINSDGTQATLITPMQSRPTAILASQTQVIYTKKKDIKNTIPQFKPKNYDL